MLVAHAGVMDPEPGRTAPVKGAVEPHELRAEVAGTLVAAARAVGVEHLMRGTIRGHEW
jgi:hypothetical protein